MFDQKPYLHLSVTSLQNRLAVLLELKMVTVSILRMQIIVLTPSSSYADDFVFTPFEATMAYTRELTRNYRCFLVLQSYSKAFLIIHSSLQQLTTADILSATLFSRTILFNCRNRQRQAFQENNNILGVSFQFRNNYRRMNKWKFCKTNSTKDARRYL